MRGPPRRASPRRGGDPSFEPVLLRAQRIGRR
ncbi:hypothetical protein LINGRAHAP2_LOCUS15760 [Linum grandiflorum]